MIKTNFTALLEQALTEMPIRAGTNRKSFITKWDNASWESFWGDFDKMKSNSKKYSSKEEAKNAAIKLAQKKFDTGKSKVMVDDAELDDTIWTPHNSSATPKNPSKEEKKSAVLSKVKEVKPKKTR